MFLFKGPIILSRILEAKAAKAQAEHQKAARKAA